MSKKLMAWVLAFVMVLGMLPAVALAEGADAVTEADLVISDVAGMQALSENFEDYADATIKLDADIDLTDVEWAPLGGATRSGTTVGTGIAFTGTFDGQDNTISGLTIEGNTYGEDVCVGLFGALDGATVKNLELDVEINVPANDCAGAVAGLSVGNTTISNVTVNGTVTAGESSGGLVGRMIKEGHFVECENNAAISGGGKIGGIVGGAYYQPTNTGLTITDCVNNGTVTSTAGYVGGIAGLSAGEIDGCTNTADITGANTGVGGIVGEQTGLGSITDCVNEGDVTNNANAYGTGGIVGWVRYADTTNYEIEAISVTGNTNYGTIDGGTDAGGIVGTLYNAGVVTGNKNYAASLTGSGFAGGVVANLQHLAGGFFEGGSVTITGNTTTTEMENISANCANLFVWNNAADYFTNVKDNVVPAVATIGDDEFTSLQAAFAAVQDGETIQLLEGTVVLGTVKMPATLKNVTLKGADDHASVLKNGVIRAADGNSLCYEGLTFDGVVFENAYIGITGWRAGDESYKDLTVTNCVFKDVENTTNEGAVHLNLEKNAAVNGFTFTNNVIDGLLGGQKSGVYGEFTGKFTYTGNTVNNVTFRPMVAQFADQDGIEDIAVVEDNIFSGSAVGRVQLLGSHENYVPKGTDKLSVSITNNIFTDITNAQQICCWGLATNGGTFDISKNYYDIDLEANPSRIYFNGAAANLADLVEKGVYPIYTELNEDGTIDTESAYTPDGVASVDNVDYYDLQTAINAADGKTVVVLADIELGETLRVEAGKTVTLDLNGKTVSMVWEEDITANHAMILNYGDLTIQDSSEDESGELFYQYTGADTNFGKATDTISSQPGSVLTLESGSVVNKTTANGIAYAVDGMTNGGIGEVTLNFKGGYVSSEKIAVRIFANSTTKTGYLNISGGEFHGRVQIHSSNANANLAEIAISGGEFHANSYKPHALYLDGSGNFAAVKASVTGGEFYGEVSSQVENFITGGQFTDDIIDYVPLPGYTDYNDGMYGVVFDAVAAIGYEEYKFLQDAIDDAENGDTIKLLGDIVLGSPVTVPAGLEITLDLNGKTVSYVTTADKGEAMITNKGDLTITDSGKGGKLSYAYAGTPDNKYTYGNSTIENKGVLTLEAGTVENTSAAMSHASYAINTGAGADLYVEGGKVLNLNGHAIRMTSFGPGATNVTVSGGYVEGTRAIQFQLPGGATSTTAPEMNLLIEGGELKSNEETYNLAVYVYSNGQSAANATVTVTGGTLNGNVALNGAATNTMAADSASVTGGTINGAYGIYSYADDEAAIPVIAITGGTFATNYSQLYCAEEDYLFVENADGTYGVEMNVDATIDGVEYPTLAKAIAAAEEGDTIVLAKDIVAAETIEVGADKVITLDLNGYTLSMVRTEQIIASDTLIRNKGDLTITDSSEDESGKISYKFDGTVAADKQWKFAVTTISNQQGTLTVEGGTIESLSLSTNSEGASTYVYKFTIDSLTNGGNGDATLNISGGKITAAKGGPVRGFANSSTCTNTINITGGEFVGQVWMQDPSAGANKGVLNITGGEITSFIEGVDAVYFYGLGDASGFEVNIGGDVVINGSTYLTVEDTTKPFKANISGGTFNGDVWTSTWDSNEVETAVPTITGGTFMYDPTDYLAEGYFSVENADGTYGVSGVIEVNGETYADLQEAVDAAEAGDTVTLLDSITLTETVKIEAGKEVILDLNGYTVDYDHEVWVYGAAKSGTALLTVCFGGDLTIKDSSDEQTGTLDASYNIGVNHSTYDVYSAVMMTAKGDDAANGTAKLTVNGGTLKGCFSAVAGNRDRDDTEIVINGGKLTVAISDIYGTAAIEHPMNGKLTINGGIIEGMDGISMRSGELLITDGTIIGYAPESAFDDDGYWDNNFAACTGNALQIVSRENSEGSTNENPTVSITGGTFTSEHGTAVGSYAGANDTELTGFISGGTYSSNPAKYLADGLKSVRNANGTFNVEKREYTVNFMDADGTTVLDKNKAYFGDAVTAPANPVKEGYNFLAWLDAEGNKVDFAAFTMPNSDVTLTAQWVVVPTVSDPVPSAANANVGEEVSFTVVPAGAEGEFTYQWQYKSPKGSWTNTTLTGNKTDTLTVKATAGRNGYSYRCVVTDAYGFSVESEGAVLTVNTMWITVQPEDAEVYLGVRTAFKAEAEGGEGEFTYQWYFRADDEDGWQKSGSIGNKTNTLRILATESRDGYQVYCVITDEAGTSVESEIATLTVIPESPFVAQPEDAEVEEGDVAYFSIEMHDDDLYTYQWQYRAPNGSWTDTTLSGNKTTTLKVTGTLGRDGYEYHCVVTDENGYTLESEGAFLTVNPMELAFVSEPEDAEVDLGEYAEFTVEVEGGVGEYTYQWQYSANNGRTWNNTTLTGNKTDTLTVKATTGRDGYQYRCVVTDEADTEIASVGGTLTVAELPVLAFAAEPEDVEVILADYAEFTVEVEGGVGEYTYQWQYSANSGRTWKNTTLTGNKTDTLTVKATTGRDGYQYRCVVTDEAGTEIASVGGTLILVKAPELAFAAEPEDFEAALGEYAEFTVEVEGGEGDYTYQWQYKSPKGSWTNTTLTGNKTDTLTVKATSGRNGYSYRCVVTDETGTEIASVGGVLTVVQ